MYTLIYYLPLRAPRGRGIVWFRKSIAAYDPATLARHSNSVPAIPVRRGSFSNAALTNADGLVLVCRELNEC